MLFFCRLLMFRVMSTPTSRVMNAMRSQVLVSELFLGLVGVSVWGVFSPVGGVVSLTG